MVDVLIEAAAGLLAPWAAAVEDVGVANNCHLAREAAAAGFSWLAAIIAADKFGICWSNIWFCCCCSRPDIISLW